MSSIWVYASIPEFENDVMLPFEREIRVYPMKDLAFKYGIADDVEFLGADGRWHPFETHERDYEILKFIEKFDPDAHAEIFCRREANALGSSGAALEAIVNADPDDDPPVSSEAA